MTNCGDFAGHQKIGRPKKLSAEDELLLTLCKLRHDFPEEDLGRRFNISQTAISRIFLSWVELLESTFSEINLWPEKDVVVNNMPEALRLKYPDTRVIIDAAELSIQQPQNPDTQSVTWSAYKNRNTLKFLLGVTPNGVPCFVSDCFGGRISDLELTRRCGLISRERFLRGDAIMADKGFTISELLSGTRIRLNHPPFLEKKDGQLTEEEVIETRRIASLRIHVERAIESIKSYHILDGLPPSRVVYGSRLVKICTFLTTLLPPLVPTPVDACAVDACGAEEESLL